jgi:hypothetical protein
MMNAGSHPSEQFSRRLFAMLGRRTAQPTDRVIALKDLPPPPAHPFYDRLNRLLQEAAFDPFVEDLCRSGIARRFAGALPSYLNDESVAGQDVLVWYVVHVHHLPRTEDWPGMPVEWVGFTLKPRDFLDASPVQPK